MKALILAAGKGERLRPLTDYKPKSMLPVGEKLLIDHILDRLKDVKLDEIGVVIGHQAEALKGHLGDSVKYYRDLLLKGTGSAILAAKDFIDEECLIIYGDLYFEENLGEVIGKLSKVDLFICSTVVGDTSRYGKILRRGNENLLQILEKTEGGQGEIFAGIAKIGPGVLDVLENLQESERAEYEFTQALNIMAKKKEIKVVPLRGYWRDVGYPWDLLEVNLHYLKTVGSKIHPDAEIWPQAILKRPVIIGEGTVVKNSIIENAVVGRNCVIGEFSVVKRSIIMDYSNAPHLNYVGDSIIAEGVNLGAGTKIANLRFDEKPVKVTIKGKRISSGRRKLGAIIGYNVKTGINVSIYPGVKIGSNSWIEAEILVDRDVPSNTFVRKLGNDKKITTLKGN